MINERNSLNTMHKITLDGLRYRLNQLIILALFLYIYVCVCVCVCVSVVYSINKRNFFLKSWIIFFLNFFHQDKLCIVWNWIVGKIILISKNICFGALENCSQSEYSRLEQRSVSWEVKFIDKCVICTEKQILVKNIYKCAELFKVGWNHTQNEDRSNRLAHLKWWIQFLYWSAFRHLITFLSNVFSYTYIYSPVDWFLI